MIHTAIGRTPPALLIDFASKWVEKDMSIRQVERDILAGRGCVPSGDTMRLGILGAYGAARHHNTRRSFRGRGAGQRTRQRTVFVYHLQRSKQGSGKILRAPGPYKTLGIVCPFPLPWRETARAPGLVPGSSGTTSRYAKSDFHAASEGWRPAGAAGMPQGRFRGLCSGRAGDTMFFQSSTPYNRDSWQETYQQ